MSVVKSVQLILTQNEHVVINAKIYIILKKDKITFRQHVTHGNMLLDHILLQTGTVIIGQKTVPAFIFHQLVRL